MARNYWNGKGAVGTFRLKTVRNNFWGISSDVEVVITFVHAARAMGWEQSLSNDMKEVMGIVDDKPPNKKEYKNFPNWSTGALQYSAENANLMANYAEWIVNNNAHHFNSWKKKSKPEILNCKQAEFVGDNLMDEIKKSYLCRASCYAQYLHKKGLCRLEIGEGAKECIAEVTQQLCVFKRV